MKKILSIILISSICSSVVLANEPPTIVFNSLQQAQDNCPAPADLTFMQVGRVVNSKGEFSGDNKQGLPFISYNSLNFDSYYSAPKDLNKPDVNFAKRGTIYGYKNNRKTLCFYDYTNFVYSTVHLIMRSE